ncbi:MAG: hypothetical protein AB1551_04125 [Actinomycetota bacterium]
MSKKRRKGKARSDHRPPKPVVTTTEERPKRSDTPPPLGWLSRSGDPRWPSIPNALGRGFVAAASSPIVLAIPFLFVFLGWIALVGLGLEGPSALIVDLAALPPVGTYFDASNGITIYGYGLPALLAAIGFVVVRSLFVAVMTGLIVQSLEGEQEELAGVVRGLRAYPVVLAVNIISMSMMLAGSLILPYLGEALGSLGSVLILVAALFLFAFTPTAAVREREGLMETLRRSTRAAMMPGSRHAIMSMLYIFLALPILVAFAPHGNELTANPRLATWIYGLVVTFVHSAFLAAFAYRWMAVESAVPDGAVRAGGR